MVLTLSLTSSTSLFSPLLFLTCATAHLFDFLSRGSGEDGQLGLGTDEDKELACVVEALEPFTIRSVVGGSRNSLAICDDGKVTYRIHFLIPCCFFFGGFCFQFNKVQCFGLICDLILSWLWRFLLDFLRLLTKGFLRFWRSEGLIKKGLKSLFFSGSVSME